MLEKKVVSGRRLLLLPSRRNCADQVPQYPVFFRATLTSNLNNGREWFCDVDGAITEGLKVRKLSSVIHLNYSLLVCLGPVFYLLLQTPRFSPHLPFPETFSFFALLLTDHRQCEGAIKCR